MNPYEEALQEPSAAPPPAPSQDDPYSAVVAPAASAAPPQDDPYAAVVKQGGNPYAAIVQEPTTNPATSDPAQGPGFWASVGAAAKKGLLEGGLETAQLAQAAARKAQGDTFFQQEPPPEIHTEVDDLLKKPVSQGWTDPKWWGSQIVYGTTKSAPALSLGIAGSLAGAATPVPGGALIGGGLGFAAGSGLATLIPAYQRAKAEGLSDDDAIDRALLTSGVAAAVGGAMGLAPGARIFGTSSEVVGDTVVQALRRPVMESLVQLGVVQPTIGATGHVVQEMAQGRKFQDVSPDEVLTSFAVNLGTGVVIAGPHLLATARPRRVETPTPPPVSPDLLGEVFRAQEPPKDGHPPTIGSSPEAVPAPFDAPLTDYQRALDAGEHPLFYSQLARTVEEKGPSSASGEQWLGMLRNHPGVKGEELQALDLPRWLEGQDGKISKKDLQLYIEDKNIGLETVVHEDYHMPGGPFDRVNTTYIDFRLPGPVTRYGEVKLYFENKGEPFMAKHFAAGIKEEGGIKSPALNENLLGFVQYTGRLDRDGKHTLHIETMQDELHKAARDKGYRGDPVRTFEDALADGEVVVARAGLAKNTWRARIPGKNINFPMELSEEAAKASAKKFFEERQQEVIAQRPPQIPFRSSWPDLMFKRMLRFAADEGFERISWSGGEHVSSLFPQASKETHQFFRNLYDRDLAKIATGWGKKLGVEGGETRLDLGRVPERPADLLVSDTVVNKSGIDLPVRYMDVSPAASDRIKLGMPLYSRKLMVEDPTIVLKGNTPYIPPNIKEMHTAVKPIVGILTELKRRFGIDHELELSLGTVNQSGTMGYLERAQSANGLKYRLHLYLGEVKTIEQLFQVAAHEFGHFVMYTKYADAPDNVKIAIKAQFDKYRQEYPQTAKVEGRPVKIKDVLALRDDPISQFHGTFFAADPVRAPEINVLDMTPSQRAYWTGFNEWFAQQVARWATTDQRPIGVVDKFFSALGAKIREVLEFFRGKGNLQFNRRTAMDVWLNSLFDKERPVFGPEEVGQAELNTKKKNAEAFDRGGAGETPATPETPSTGGGRGVFKFFGFGERGGNEMAAAADRMNKFYEWMISMPQLAKSNPHIRSLQLYKEMVSLMHLEKNQMMGEKKIVLDAWKKLSRPQNEALGRFIDDYMNGRYLSDEDMKLGLRRPTKKEFEDLVAKHKLGDDAIRVFDAVRKSFDVDLMRYRDILLRETSRIKDPLEQARAMARVDERIAAMQAKPYMPAMRFGNFTVTVYDAAGKVKHFETFETARRQQLAAKELEGLKDPTDKVLPGFLKKDVRPLLGMPPGLLDLMAEKLNLSSSQKATLDQLKFEYAPAQSFRHRFQQKELTSGYSDDWQRAFAHHGFHGANHFARVKYADQLRDMVGQVWNERYSRTDATKLDQIRNFMSEHMNQLLDPKPDWATLRGLMFHWYLGFNPAAAVTNLSQVPFQTFPFLASKFGGLGLGDARALSALTKASTSLNTYYRKNTLLASTSGEQRALGEAVREGIISETQAHDLAAIGEGRTLFKGFGRPGERAWQSFSELSAKMFETAEQWNRRVSFRAAWDLALQHPESKYVQEQVRANPLQFQRLLEKGWTQREAAAFTAAKDVVESTQFTYAPYARPKFMWGKKGALFVFKSFQQNTLFNLWNYPAAAARSLLIMGATAGLMGLPGSEDMSSLIKGIGARLFGKDWDPEQEVRKFILDLGEERIKPDLLLHGISRYGFGIPQVADMLGQYTGFGDVPVPSVDMSRNLSMGNILPFDAGKLITPTRDAAGNEVRQIQRASGAMFGLGFALYNFLTSRPLEEPDSKKWEQVIPRAMANANQAFRYYREGKERNKLGSSIVRFDPNDTEQMAELVAKGLGFQPSRLTARWDNIAAKAEATAYWDIRRDVLMRQFWAAYKSGDKDSLESVKGGIKNFNSQLPPEARAKAITSEALTNSVQSKARTNALQEQGLPTSMKNLGIYKEIDRLYPEGAPAGLNSAKRVQ